MENMVINNTTNSLTPTTPTMNFKDLSGKQGLYVLLMIAANTDAFVNDIKKEEKAKTKVKALYDAVSKLLEDAAGKEQDDKKAQAIAAAIKGLFANFGLDVSISLHLGMEGGIDKWECTLTVNGDMSHLSEEEKNIVGMLKDAAQAAYRVVYYLNNPLIESQIARYKKWADENPWDPIPLFLIRLLREQQADFYSKNKNAWLQDIWQKIDSAKDQFSENVSKSDMSSKGNQGFVDRYYEIIKSLQGVMNVD
jgi:hypothetical protein